MPDAVPTTTLPDFSMPLADAMNTQRAPEMPAQ